jgi:hypothetical protein
MVLLRYRSGGTLMLELFLIEIAAGIVFVIVLGLWCIWEYIHWKDK